MRKPEASPDTLPTLITTAPLSETSIARDSEVVANNTLTAISTALVNDAGITRDPISLTSSQPETLTIQRVQAEAAPTVIPSPDTPTTEAMALPFDDSPSITDTSLASVPTAQSPSVMRESEESEDRSPTAAPDVPLAEMWVTPEPVTQTPSQSQTPTFRDFQAETTPPTPEAQPANTPTSTEAVIPFADMAAAVDTPLFAEPSPPSPSLMREREALPDIQRTTTPDAPANAVSVTPDPAALTPAQPQMSPIRGIQAEDATAVTIDVRTADAPDSEGVVIPFADAPLAAEAPLVVSTPSAPTTLMREPEASASAPPSTRTAVPFSESDAASAEVEPTRESITAPEQIALPLSQRTTQTIQRVPAEIAPTVTSDVRPADIPASEIIPFTDAPLATETPLVSEGYSPTPTVPAATIMREAEAEAAPDFPSSATSVMPFGEPNRMPDASAQTNATIALPDQGAIAEDQMPVVRDVLPFDEPPILDAPIIPFMDASLAAVPSDAAPTVMREPAATRGATIMRDSTGSQPTAISRPPGRESTSGIGSENRHASDSGAAPENGNISESEPNEPPATHGVDIFQALTAAGLVSRSADETAEMPAVQYTPDEDEESLSPAAESFFTSPQGTDLYSAMLSMGLIPGGNTGSGNKANSARPTPSEPATPSGSAAAGTIQRTPVDQIDRAISDTPSPTTTNDTTSDVEPEIDVEALAQTVYRHLKDRLRIEAERGRSKF